MIVLILKPFLKWPGGKRQSINILNNKFSKITFNTYIEPFVGAGSVFLNFQYNNTIINDINSSLINIYIQIKNNLNQLLTEINKLNIKNITNEYYLLLREQYNQKIISNIYDTECAALLYILNHTCFNGLYRVNKNNLFNVPWNKSDKQLNIDINNFKNISLYLQNIKIYNDDFENICKLAKKNDLIYFDPPFMPLNKTSNFTAYTKNGFNNDEQIRLANCIKTLDKQGVFFVLSNHNTDLINELYKNYNIDIIQVKRNINCNGKKRVGEEIIITNFGA